MKWVCYHKAEVINEGAVCRGASLPWVSILGALMTVVPKMVAERMGSIIGMAKGSELMVFRRDSVRVRDVQGTSEVTTLCAHVRVCTRK